MRRVFSSTSFSKPLGSYAVAAPAQTGNKTVSKIGGKLTVVTQDATSSLSAMGVFMLSGSRFEDVGQTGMARLSNELLLKTGYSGTALGLSRQLALLGGVHKSAVGREVNNVTVSASGDKILKYTELVVGAVTGPMFESADVKTAVQNFGSSRDERAQLEDLLYATAYGNVGLGNRVSPPAELLSTKTDDDLVGFYLRNVVPERVVVSGYNVNHEAFVKAIEKSLEPMFMSRPKSDFEPVKTVYRGGQAHVAEAVRSGHTNVAIGFKGFDAKSDDLYAATVLAAILGGGSSFSEGGPGKGMHSHLYTTIMGTQGWVQAANAAIQPHFEQGIFYLYGSCVPQGGSALAKMLLASSSGFAKRPVSQEALDRGINGLCTTVARGYESALSVETNALDVLYGLNRPAAEIIEKLRAVSVADIQAISRKIFSSPITYVTFGSPSAPANIDELKAITASQF